ncbi:uncharacterized protein [Miscanthus floridulus]|uniref:uncharacterized protein n=1 Tax=Miscanthus floridulus TaxID=154761 RepID=UPI00345779C4
MTTPPPRPSRHPAGVDAVSSRLAITKSTRRPSRITSPTHDVAVAPLRRGLAFARPSTGEPDHPRPRLLPRTSAPARRQPVPTSPRLDNGHHSRQRFHLRPWPHPCCRSSKRAGADDRELSLCLHRTRPAPCDLPASSTPGTHATSAASSSHSPPPTPSPRDNTSLDGFKDASDGEGDPH